MIDSIMNLAQTAIPVIGDVLSGLFDLLGKVVDLFSKLADNAAQQSSLPDDGSKGEFASAYNQGYGK